MVAKGLPFWQPDLRLSPRATLQEFVRHDEQAILRIILHTDQRAQVEVNDQIVAETTGFKNAAALAELYTRSHEILLAADAEAAREKSSNRRHYCVRSANGLYEISSGVDPVAFLEEPDGLRSIGSCDTIIKAIDLVRRDAGGDVVPAFADQVETYRGLGKLDSAGIVVSIWTSEWRTPFIELLREDEFTPLFLSVSRAPDGTYYTIYRLADGRYLSELRSRHDAERIATFATLEAATAYCSLFNAARHSEQRLSFTKCAAKEMQSLDGHYHISESGDGFELRSTYPDNVSLGRFSGVGTAEAYATAHRDSLEHFSLHEA